MADNQLLLKKNADEGFFADDDPLAELARIVGFEPSTENQVRPVTARREPEFDLEDELLKEFEQYDAPARHDAPVRHDAPELYDVPERVEVRHEDVPERVEARHEPEVVAPELPVEQAFVAPVEPEPAHVAETVEEVVPAYQSPEIERPVLEAVTAAPVIADPVRPASHPVFELEDEILREFAAFDARRPVQGVEASQPASAALVDQLIDEIMPQAVAPAPVEVAPVANPVLQYGAPAETARFADRPEDAHFADDRHEINQQAETNAATAAAPLGSDFDEFMGEPSHHDVEPSQHDDETSHHDADFSAEQSWDDNAAALSAHDDAAAVVDQHFHPSEEHVTDRDADVDYIAAEPEAVAEPAVEPVHEHVRDRDYGLDELLGEVERYPVSPPVMQWPRSTPTLAGARSGPAAIVAQAPEIAETIAAEPELSVVEPAGLAAPAIAEAEETAPIVEAVHAHDAFDEGAFELDLSEIELDLLEVETLTDTVAHADAVSASVASMAAMAETVVPEKPVLASERTAAHFAAEQHSVDDYSALPFDPTQIAGEEDPVEAIADMDVPEIPQDHSAVPPTVQPDYDIDIDAEMAHLFHRSATAPGRPSAAQAVAAASVNPAPVVPASPLTDLDDFERALEEDFRKSMTENRAVPNPDRVALSPAGYPINGNEPSSSRRIMMLAASVAAIVLLGGAGVYAFMGGHSSMLQTASEPKIILADKDPVKMVPEDKGGQQVPNQDKAVYDRVSGEKADASKQERLVTSDEEPVDVVQKTLMPENLPMDDEEGANTTQTADTSDPRLLPDGVDKNVSTSEKVTSGVAPRKVRTMVVRADGTLVPREELADDQPVAEDASKSKERSVQLAKADPVVPERLAESATDSIASEINAAQPLEPAAQAKAADPVLKQPVVADAKPVVAAKSVIAAEPVQAEDAVVKSDIKPADSTDQAAAKQSAADTETALADAANAEVDAPVRPVKTTKIVNAHTPIPENRPVEQPVNVVGTVSDKGKVEDSTQQVAAADPVVQPGNASAVPAGSYVIQIASLPSEAEAQSSYTKLSSKFASVIGGKGVDIRRAEVKNKGTYYRVRIPAGSRQEAAALCAEYKSAGGSCLVSK